METILVASPLRNGCCSKPYRFSNGVEIRQIKPILWEVAVARGCLSEEERDYLDTTQFWVAATKEVESYSTELEISLYEKARCAMYALQIICPSGGRNLFLTFRETATGFDNLGSNHHARMHSTLIGRLASPEELGLPADFEKVFQGLSRVFEEKIVRLENPIFLIEHGLATLQPFLRNMMWVMGLDMLFMAGEKLPFVERVNGFLGSTTSVFPEVFPHRQPGLKVADIVEDVYELRNIVAHGREVPERFRQRRDILDTDGVRINVRELQYAQVIMESALFLLARSLRKIMIDGLVDLVKDGGGWKQSLKVAAKVEQQRAGA